MLSARPNVLRDVQETSDASDPVGFADRDRASDRHAADDGTAADWRNSVARVGGPDVDRTDARKELGVSAGVHSRWLKTR